MFDTTLTTHHSNEEFNPISLFKRNSTQRIGIDEVIQTPSEEENETMKSSSSLRETNIETQRSKSSNQSYQSIRTNQSNQSIVSLNLGMLSDNAITEIIECNEDSEDEVVTDKEYDSVTVEGETIEEPFVAKVSSVPSNSSRLPRQKDVIATPRLDKSKTVPILQMASSNDSMTDFELFPSLDGIKMERLLIEATFLNKRYILYIISHF